uniref:Uncharacterized protein n=1 Tax=Anopheles funestus TaxID=62324 RepID=A0A182S0M8_ANOFN
MIKISSFLLFTVLLSLFYLAVQTETPPSSLSTVNAPQRTTAVQNLSPVTDTDALGRKIFIPVFRYKKKQSSKRIRVQNRS